MLNQLFATPDNPAPEGAVTTVLTTADGVRLRAARFPATAPSRGTVVIFQGRGEQIEKYFSVIRQLQARGLTAVAFDWRGQGGSQRLARNRRKGHARDFRHFERDIEVVRRMLALPDCPPPFFGLAHSMGAAIALAASPRLVPWIGRMVLTAPMFDFAPSRWSRRSVRLFAGTVSALGFGRLILPRALRGNSVTADFRDNPLTSDSAAFERNMAIGRLHPELQVGAPTFGWVAAAAKAMDRLDHETFPDKVPIPVLIVNSGDERLVNRSAIERMAQRLRVAGYVLVPGARHEVMQERPVFQDAFWAAFDAFIPGGGPL